MPVSYAILKLQQRLVEDLPDDATVKIWRGFVSCESLEVGFPGRAYTYVVPQDDEKRVSYRTVGMSLWRFASYQTLLDMLLKT